MNITPELKKLRYRLESMVASKYVKGIVLGQAECVLALALLDSTQKPEPGSGDEKILRRLLWLRHDSSHSDILYGDDGEMQCAACMIDFKRMTAADIEARLTDLGMKKLTEALSRPAPAPASVTREQIRGLLRKVMYSPLVESFYGDKMDEGVDVAEKELRALGVSVEGEK